MGVYLPTEEELETGRGDFTLLPEDLYVVEVAERKLKDLMTPATVMQPNPYNKTEEHPNGVERPVLNVALRVISFSNGDPLVDENGDDVTDERFFFAFLDTTKVGLKPQPSAFRKFITAAFGLAPKESVNIEDWSELVGKRMLVAMEHNKGKHKVKDYQPIRARRRAAAASTPAPAAPADDADALAAKAAEAFGEDAPSF